jgi:alpha-ribazole phosphatase
MLKLILVRHGESEANLGHFINDDPSRAVALTATGKAQSRLAGIALRDFRFDAAYCSQFLRARQTASLILAGAACDIVVDARINERRSGMDGLPVDTFNDLVKPDPLYIKPPGGESFVEQMKRVGTFLADLRWRHPDNANLLIVSHENPIMAIRAVMGMAPDLAVREPIGNCEWRVLRLSSLAVAYLEEQDNPGETKCNAVR